MRGAAMTASHGGNPIGMWASWRKVGLLALAVVGVSIVFDGGSEPQVGGVPVEAGRPAGELDREECGSAVWALAVSPGGASLGAATIGGEVRVIGLPSTPLLRLESGS